MSGEYVGPCQDQGDQNKKKTNRGGCQDGSACDNRPHSAHVLDRKGSRTTNIFLLKKGPILSSGLMKRWVNFWVLILNGF